MAATSGWAGVTVMYLLEEIRQKGPSPHLMLVVSALQSLITAYDKKKMRTGATKMIN